MKCDNCNKAATVHLTEVKAGKRIEKHMCEQCAAAAEGLPAKSNNMPINELLTKFVMAHSGMPSQEQALQCEHCGMTWAEFRQNGLLGCPNDYTAFERELAPLMQRAHDGATHHVGKQPARRGGSGVPMKRHVDLAKLRRDLQKAVEGEEYERAAKLRDQIRVAEL